MARDERVFIAYDFNIKDGLGDRLLATRKKAAKNGIVVEYPDPLDSRGQGEIWGDIVRPGIERADKVIAYVDLPNANVGYELGYALAARNGAIQVAIARVGREMPRWLTLPPLNGMRCPQAQTATELMAVVTDSSALSVGRVPRRGTDVVFLCPPASHDVYLDAVREAAPSWRVLDVAGWNLKTLPELLDGAGAVVWLITPHSDGESSRDGDENAAAAVVAGFAAGLGLPLHVLLHAEARTVVDVVGGAFPLGGLAQLPAIVRELNERLEEKLAPPSAPALASASPAVVRPRIPTLPQLGGAATMARLFVGREVFIGDLTDALKGLQARASGIQLGGAAHVRATWYHGFGGMGKSWFLKRAYIECQAQLQLGKVAFIDWDSDLWRQPLQRTPERMTDVLDVVAYRLVQLCGEAAADGYWEARARVERMSEPARKLRGRLLGELDERARGKSHVHFDQALRELGWWSDDPKDLERRLDEVRKDQSSLQQLHHKWFDAGGGGGIEDVDREALLDGDALCIRALRERLTRAAQTEPLVLIFDTCEVLSVELDRVLRRLVVPLCQDESAPVLVLLASRAAPDAGEPRHGRQGWRPELPGGQLRIVPFDEGVQFTVQEIEIALSRAQPPVEDSQEIAPLLHEVTRGLPLAVRALIDMHEEGDDVLHELARTPVQDAHALDRVRDVEALVADRFLYHLEHQPGREADLQDIVALALLPQIEGRVMSRYWGSDAGHRERLRELANRYSLLSRGDLHETVRTFLRRKWRTQERPQCFGAVLARLRACMDPPSATAPICDGAQLNRAALLLDIESWHRTAADVLRALAPALASALAFRLEPDPLLKLAFEMSDDDASARAVLEMLRQAPSWNYYYRPWANFPLVQWLSDEQGKGPWSESASAAFQLLECLAFAVAPTEPVPDSARTARVAEQLLGSWATLQEWRPRPDDVLGALNGVGCRLIESHVELAERCLSQALQIESGTGFIENNLAIVLQARGKAVEAEALYRTAAASRSDDPQYVCNLGLLLNGQKRWDEAEAAYRLALERDAGYAPAHDGLGLLEKERERPEQAEECFERAMALDAKEPSYADNLGDLLREQKRWDEAESAYRAALELDAGYARAHNGLGLLAKERGRLEQAAECFNRAMALDAKEPVYAENLGDLLREQQRWDEAVAAYRAALERDAGYASTHNGLGLLEKERGRLEQAAECFNRAMALDAKEPVYAGNLGDLLREQKRWDEADVAYRAALERDAGYAPTHNRLGLLEKRRGRLEQAEECFDRAMALDTKEPIYARNLGDLLSEQKRWDEADVAYRAALERDAGHAPTHNRLGLLEKRRGRLEQAEECFNRAMALDAKQPIYAVNLGNLLRERKKWDEAEAAYRAALERDAGYVPAHNGLGLLEKQRGRLAQAEDCFKRAMALDAKQPVCANNLGGLLREQKRWDEAEAVYRLLLERDAGYAPAHNGLGLLEKERGRFEQAEEWLEKATALDAKQPIYAVNLGNLLREQKKWDEAEAAYRLALERDAGYAPAYNGLGLLEKARGGLEHAVQHFNEATALDAKRSMYWHNLGRLLTDMQRFEEAEAAFRSAVQRASDDRFAVNNLAWFLRLRPGRLHEAWALATRAAGLYRDVVIVHTLADIEARMQHPNVFKTIADLAALSTRADMDRIGEDCRSTFDVLHAAGLGDALREVLARAPHWDLWEPLLSPSPSPPSEPSPTQDATLVSA